MSNKSKTGCVWGKYQQEVGRVKEEGEEGVNTVKVPYTLI
jgi:hypothetical protein